MRAETLGALLAEVERKRPVVLATNLESGEQRLLHRGEGGTDSERTDVERALRLDACVTTEREAGPRIFYQPFNPPLRMILVGAVHIAQPLSAMATIAGYEVTIVDPRESFAAADRFAGVTLSVQWPDAALESAGLDPRCAVVTLTHDPKLDDPALQVALRSDAFFIGCLGSKKTHASRLRRLSKAGFSEPELQRVRGPVGLPIGSRSPAEIAISVLAEVTQTLRKPERGKAEIG
jgi:xanthine dehydrogenase accessory factor